jgi:hypothetical protein
MTDYCLPLGRANLVVSVEPQYGEDGTFEDTPNANGVSVPETEDLFLISAPDGLKPLAGLGADGLDRLGVVECSTPALAVELQFLHLAPNQLRGTGQKVEKVRGLFWSKVPIPGAGVLVVHLLSRPLEGDLINSYWAGSAGWRLLLRFGQAAGINPHLFVLGLRLFRPNYLLWRHR